MTGQPGALMASEVAEQPTILGGLVEHRAEIADIASRLAAARPRFVLLAARGSSDHAALYAKYLVEVLLQLPAGLVSPSTTTLYGAEPDLTDVLWISVSQSGGSPDLVEATDGAKMVTTSPSWTNKCPTTPGSAAATSIFR